jgi:hypothetical protein
VPKTTHHVTTDQWSRIGSQRRLPVMPAHVQKVALLLALIGFLPFAIAGNIPAAIMSASIWIGVVYFGFLLAYGAREVIRRVSRPPDH